MVQPGMVYISMPTEFGMVYTQEELTALYGTCQKYGLRLFIDGARLGYGLESEACDYDLPFLAKHCDVFYIGGTKVGAMMGEAVVFSGMNAPKYFFTTVKRHGALLAKGRMLGRRAANIDLPDPGGPIISILCPPAAAISMARFAIACPFTSEKSKS